MEFRTAVKKQQGRLIVDETSLKWAPDNAPETIVKLTGVAGMKATPPTAAKSRIQLLAPDLTLVFDFATRPDLDNARDHLQAAIQKVRDTSQTASKSGTPEVPSGQAGTPAGPASGPPSAAASGTATPVGASAKPVGDGVRKKKIGLDPKRLLANLDLQRQILRDDKSLARTFQQVVVSGNMTNDQFWTMRLDLLLTAALQNSQARGAYNVLSTLRPATGSDNQINLSLTREKIHDIFDQYPIVRKAYNDSVPGISEGEFWQRFFMSRLFLRLRGERISTNHPPDYILDKYIDILEDHRKRQKLNAASGYHVPYFIDVEANSENNPESYGNRPDMTMRLEYNDKASEGLIRSMNGLSKRLLVGKNPRTAAATNAETAARANSSDRDLAAQLVLGDLETSRHETGSVALRLNPGQEAANGTVDLSLQAHAQTELAASFAAPLDLNTFAANKAALNLSQQHVGDLLMTEVSISDASMHVDASDEVLLCQAATVEFLKQFWYARSHKLPVDHLLDVLSKSVERIKVASSASVDPLTMERALDPLVKSVSRALTLGSSE